MLKPYQKERIISFIKPSYDVQGAGYNAYQSVVAIGSGGLFGKGIGYGTQSRLGYLPEYHTDFIFAAFAEEWGFIGVVFMLILFSFLFLRIIYIAIYSQNSFVQLLAVGVAAVLLVHFIVNIGMNLRLLPVTGIPLPFVSYGGSHLLSEYIMIALLTSFLKFDKN